MSLPVTRTLIGVDFPSFIAPFGSCRRRRIRTPGRRICVGPRPNAFAEHVRHTPAPTCDRCSASSWTRTIGVHRPGVGGVGGRPVGGHADLGDDDLEVLLGSTFSRMNFSTRRRSGRLRDLDPGAGLAARTVHLEGAGVDLGEELAAEWFGPIDGPCIETSQGWRQADGDGAVRGCRITKFEPAEVIGDPPVDRRGPTSRRPARPGPASGRRLRRGRRTGCWGRPGRPARGRCPPRCRCRCRCRCRGWRAA